MPEWQLGDVNNVPGAVDPISWLTSSVGWALWMLIVFFLTRLTLYIMIEKDFSPITHDNWNRIY